MEPSEIPDCVVAALLLAVDIHANPSQEIPELKERAKAVEELLLDYYWPEEKDDG